MLLPVITETGRNVLQLHNQVDEPLYALINGQEVECYEFTLYNEKGKPRANYVVCRNGIVFCVDRWRAKKHLKWLVEDEMAKMRDVDPFSPFEEFDLPDLW